MFSIHKLQTKGFTNSNEKLDAYMMWDEENPGYTLRINRYLYAGESLYLISNNRSMGLPAWITVA
jgi:hypothetical protein